ncbi:MAG: hypothetical protein JWR38_1646 [Mucilaginibacter sp.]|nr:hypothetical protein [Mucilaginibacter sp.]
MLYKISPRASFEMTVFIGIFFRCRKRPACGHHD